MSKYGEELYLMNWVNTYLPKDSQIKNFATDFSDGTTFVRFLERLSGKKCNAKMLEPKNEIFKLQNCKVGIDMARTMVSNLMIDGRNLISGQDYDVKLIIGFIFDLVLHYQVNQIELSDDEGQQFTGKNALLQWAKRKSRNDSMGININDFKSGWNDGFALMQIANSYDDGAFDLQKQKNIGSDLNSNKDRIHKVLDYFQQKYDVPRIIDDDFAENQNERACITYLSSLYQALKNKTGGQAVQQLLKHIRDVKNAYQQMQKAQDNFEKAYQDADGKIKQFHTGAVSDLEKLEQQLADIRKSYKSDIHELKKLLLSVEETSDLVQDLLTSYGFSTQSKVLAIDDQRLDSNKYSAKVDNYSNSTLAIIQSLSQIIEDKKTHGQSLRVKYWTDMFTQYANQNKISKDNLEKLLISIDMQFYLDQIMPKDKQSIEKDDFVQKMLQIESQSANEEQVTNTFSQLLQDRKLDQDTIQLFNLNQDDQKYLLQVMQEAGCSGESGKLVCDLFRKQ